MVRQSLNVESGLNREPLASPIDAGFGKAAGSCGAAHRTGKDFGPGQKSPVALTRRVWTVHGFS